MIEDATHLEVLASHRRALETHIYEWNSFVSGKTDKAELLAIHRERLERLKEILHDSERGLDYLEGKPVEPKNHFATAILVGIGGGGAT